MNLPPQLPISHNQMLAPKSRNRTYYLLATACVVLLGLVSRHTHNLFPQALGKYPGDALWTLMMFFGLGCLLPRSSSARLVTYSLAISFVVEVTQLYQAPWINAVRSTLLGHLVLGSGFDTIDFLAYSVGASIGFCSELTLGLGFLIPFLRSVRQGRLPIFGRTHLTNEQFSESDNFRR